ncbi:hypothetical protein QVD17_05743 [Tagetes erecta]|uniref:Uncharacterized protein n=1 Tax=Tagetes erecta TaxID=13708 RepID=A0AAD8LEW8_TARER|nr:hypothetical protein QVD17_05743 [Tagetes erecta]
MAADPKHYQSYQHTPPHLARAFASFYILNLFKNNSYNILRSCLFESVQPLNLTDSEVGYGSDCLGGRAGLTESDVISERRSDRIRRWLVSEQDLKELCDEGSDHVKVEGTTCATKEEEEDERTCWAAVEFLKSER